MNNKTTTLGIDVGTNSLGLTWLETETLDEKRRKINKLESYVHIFPEGVLNLGQGKGKELSKNASRRQARSMRKQNNRTKLRKEHLLKALAQYDMLPFKPLIEQHTYATLTQTDAFKAWAQISPYPLRAKGVKEKLELDEIGRVLYHLAQRRGYALLKESDPSEEQDYKKLQKRLQRNQRPR